MDSLDENSCNIKAQGGAMKVIIRSFGSNEENLVERVLCATKKNYDLDCCNYDCKK